MGDEAAFPFAVPIDVEQSGRFGFGLTKREYFAGLAMQGILANASVVYKENGIKLIASEGVRMADALLAALTKPEREG